MKLVVQIEAICQHKQGRTQQILQKLMGIEYHWKTFTRTLRVPEYTNFTVIAL